MRSSPAKNASFFITPVMSVVWIFLISNYARTHTQARTYTHTHTHTHTHSLTYTHARTHAHMHTLKKKKVIVYKRVDFTEQLWQIEHEYGWIHSLKANYRGSMSV